MKCIGRVPLKENGRIKRDGQGKPVTRPCKNAAIKGGKVCPMHGGKAPQVKARAAVRAEVIAWGLGDSTVDPGEVLLRLVAQSAARTELYSQLLADAYDAAERLKAAHEAHELVASTTVEFGEDGPEAPAIQQAKADLDRIFNTGGVAALVGQQYDGTKDGLLYATGEQIRGLAELEAKERDRCANFAAKAVAAGLAERQVRLAEQQAEMVIKAIDAALDAAGIAPADRGPAKIAAARHLKAV